MLPRSLASAAFPGWAGLHSRAVCLNNRLTARYGPAPNVNGSRSENDRPRVQSWGVKQLIRVTQRVAAQDGTVIDSSRPQALLIYHTSEAPLAAWNHAPDDGLRDQYIWQARITLLAQIYNYSADSLNLDRARQDYGGPSQIRTGAHWLELGFLRRDRKTISNAAKAC